MIRNLLRSALCAVFLVVAAGGCVDPGDQPSQASLAIQSVIPDEATRGSTNLSVDQLRLRLARETETVIDTVVAFPADSNRVALRLTVLLHAKTERLLAKLQMMFRSDTLFEGTQAIDLSEGSQVLSTPIRLQYIGPGRDITSLQITPRDTVLAFGGEYIFGVVARNGSTVVPPPYYLSWKTSNPTLAKVTPAGLLTAPDARGAVFLYAFTPSGAVDSTRVSFAPAVSSLRILSGDDQTVQVSSALPIPLTIQAIGADGLQVPGVLVRFLHPTGGSVSASQVLTDAAGIATTFGISGPIAGPQVFRATVSNPALVTDFHISALPGPPAIMVAAGGDQQTGAIGTTLPLALAVRVTDANGNPLPGVTVEWQVLSGGGAVAASATLTDALGAASVQYVLGPLPGPNTVLASVPGTSLLVIFAATATP